MNIIAWEATCNNLIRLSLAKARCWIQYTNSSSLITHYVCVGDSPTLLAWVARMVNLVFHWRIRRTIVLKTPKHSTRVHLKKEVSNM